MPIYDYKCTACSNRFDAFRSMQNRDDVTCPKCGGSVVRVYEGKWAMGSKAVQSSGCSCGGNCAGCAGCGR